MHKTSLSVDSDGQINSKPRKNKLMQQFEGAFKKKLDDNSIVRDMKVKMN